MLDILTAIGEGRLQSSVSFFSLNTGIEPYLIFVFWSKHNDVCFFCADVNSR